MKKFEIPEIEISKFQMEDVLTTSEVIGGGGDNETGERG